MQVAKKAMPVWVWFVLLIPVLLAMLGVVGALGIYGVRKYIGNAKQAEASATLVQWADGLVTCGERGGALPPSTTPIPAAHMSLLCRPWPSGRLR